MLDPCPIPSEPAHLPWASACAPIVSVVVPLRDEQDNVEPLVFEIARALAPRREHFELLLVDDGSRDGTAERIKDLLRSPPPGVHLRPVALSKPRGQGAALQAGFDAALGELIVTLDGDLQDDPAEIPRLLERLEHGADVVCGWRTRRAESGRRRALSWLANRARRWCLAETVHDVGCSLRVYRRTALIGIRLEGADHRFLTAWLRLNGAELDELPVVQRPRRSGRSKYGTIDRAVTSLPALARLVRATWSRRRPKEHLA